MVYLLSGAHEVELNSKEIENLLKLIRVMNSDLVLIIFLL